MVRIKICGITNREDALFSTEMGAWALGFVFAESPRRLDYSEAGKIVKSLPRGDIIKVGVFVNPSFDELEKAIQFGHIDALQLHGNESPEFSAEAARKFSLPVIKAFRVRDEGSLLEISKYNVFALLLDSYSEKGLGGTGETFDRSIAIKAKIHGRIIVSGGVNSSSVTEIVKKVKPFAVDLSSGVEDSPGKKNHRKLKALFEILNKT